MTSNVIGLGQLRNHTCGYFGRVEDGETLGVVRRGRLVAWIQPRADDRFPDSAWIPVQLKAFRTQAGRFFDRVEAGQPIEVFYQGRPIAHICAVSVRR